jgi:hypothetical protein
MYIYFFVTENYTQENVDHQKIILYYSHLIMSVHTTVCSVCKKKSMGIVHGRARAFPFSNLLWEPEGALLLKSKLSSGGKFVRLGTHNWTPFQLETLKPAIEH